MSSTRQVLCFVGWFVMVGSAGAAQDRWQFEFAKGTPEGLVGNGRSVVRVRPAGYEFHTGGDGSAHFRLIVDGVAHELTATDAHATFFPGGGSSGSAQATDQPLRGVPAPTAGRSSITVHTIPTIAADFTVTGH